MDFQKELSFITDCIRQAFARFGACGPKDVRQKSAFDLVTEVDVNIERYITQQILSVFPGDQIHAEELSSSQAITGRTWVIDPIDGTCNFAHNIPMFGIQGALFSDGVPKLAVIYLPFPDEMYTATEGQGCF